MSPKVHLLSESLSNLIAAGEVVERPASVVKELVENSIDSGATQIDIEIQSAGLSTIRVTDNGSGMIKEDAKLAFSRHATSKVVHREDLNHILTMGFRGEALPSMAAVAKINLKTCLPNESIGFELEIEGGKITKENEIGCAPGTSIVVKDLFYNTPARKKFMKSNATEQSHISQLVELSAMAHLNIGFSYKVDKRVIIQCGATNNLEDRLAAIYQKALPNELFQVEHEAGGIWIRGLIASPRFVKPTRQGIKLYINKRPIEHRGLTHAVVQAYKTLIPDGKFPVAYLFIVMPPNLVDVNVHPSKREVKFQDEHAMYQVIKSATKTVLDQHDLTKQGGQYFISALESDKAKQHTQPVTSQINHDFNQSDDTSKWSSNRIRESVSNYYHNHAKQGVQQRSLTYQSTNYNNSVEASSLNQATDNERSLRILGQIGKTFIVGEDEEGFFIIDQHAAHERILYEELKQHQHTPGDRQPLLLPLTFDTTPAQQPILEQLLSAFDKLGLEISPMGGTTFTIQTQPTVVAAQDLVAVVQDVVAYASTTGTLPEATDINDKLLMSLSCHSAVKAGDRMQPEAMLSLINQVNQIKHLPTCPHGRPTIFRLSWGELEKYFKRDYR